jgi:hypothetical protein
LRQTCTDCRSSESCKLSAREWPAELLLSTGVRLGEAVVALGDGPAGGKYKVRFGHSEYGLAQEGVHGSRTVPGIPLRRIV